MRRALAGETLVSPEEAFAIERSLPHGHVAAVLGTARRLGLERLLGRERSRERDLCLAMVCQRLLRPGSKLSATRQFALSTLGEELAVADASEAELLAAMDWLLPRQERIEAALARRYLSWGGFVLYDLSASYLEGRSCPLAALGYPRDGKKGKLQIQYGLTCSPEGRPVAIEVFDGTIHDDKTLPDALERVKQRFGIERVVVCGDRGMVTEANIETLREHGFDWITALRRRRCRHWSNTASCSCRSSTRPTWPRSPPTATPASAWSSAATRTSRASAPASEKRCSPAPRKSSTRSRPRSTTRAGACTEQPAGLIGERAGRVVNRYKVAKHFRLTIEDGRFDYRRDEQAISEEAALDGFYVLRTSLDTDAARPRRRSCAPTSCSRHAERAFRAMKSPELEIRPIHHRLEDRVRAHVFLCMLAYASASSSSSSSPRSSSQTTARSAPPTRSRPHSAPRGQTEGREQENRRRAPGLQLPRPTRHARHPLP